MNNEQRHILQEQLKQAQEQQNKGDFDAAEKITLSVLSAVEANQNSDRESENVHAMALLRYADIQQRRGNYNTALDSAQQALTIATRNHATEGSAMAWNCIGNIHIKLGAYQTALENFDRSLAVYTESGNTSGTALITGNIGIVYWNLGNYTRAQEYMNKALLLHEELGEQSSAARVMGNIGNIYAKLGDYHTALRYYDKAVSSHDLLGEISASAHVLVNIGSIHQKLGNYTKALEYFAKTLDVYTQLGMKSGIAFVTGNIGVIHGHLGDFNSALEYYNTALHAFTELGEKSGIARVTKNIGNIYLESGNYAMALECFYRALAIHEELGEMSDIANVTGYIGLVHANSNYDGYDSTFAEELLQKALSQSIHLGLKDLLVHWNYHLSEFYRNEQRWEETYTHYKKYYEIEKEINIEEVKQQEAFRDQQKAIELAKASADAKHQATELLLHNVLPPTIAQRMIVGENLIAEKLSNVSVLFADIVNFTKLSQQITAEELVEGLDAIFSTFDTLAEKYRIEKIKTIGDAYMVVAGAPEPRADHAQAIAHFALEMLNSIKEFTSKTTGEQIQLRIGIHSGEVVAGVIGKKKFAYDLWGDAVNTASRMESHGEAGKIHVSEEFRNAVETLHTTSLQDRTTTVGGIHESKTSESSFPLQPKQPFQFIPRGEIEIKGKGTMRTYFLEKNDE